MAHPLETIMESTIGRLRELVDTNTVIGKPVSVGDGTLVIPVSRITLGFVSGGGEYGTKNPVNKTSFSIDNSNRAYPFAGTLTAGVGVRPVAFLCVQGERISVLPADTDEPLDRLIASVPTLFGEIREFIDQLAKERRNS